MEKKPNWCPKCKKETDWLIYPARLNIVQCKKCGHMKVLPGVKAKKPLEKKRKGFESIVTVSRAFITALAIALGGLLVSSIWLFLLWAYFIRGGIILAAIFLFLAGVSALTVAVYVILSEAEKIAEKKVKQMQELREKR